MAVCLMLSLKNIMTSIETFEQLLSNFDKTLTALLNVRSIDEIYTERRMSGHVYTRDINCHEFWIALGRYSVSSNLSLLGFIINDREELLPTKLNSRQDIADYCAAFKNNRDKVIAAFDSIIGKPNILFIGYANPITMEQYLQDIVTDIIDEAQNLEYNYKILKTL
jgi:chorismate mutase